eukprot:204918-Pleurochrysis_carterae.AAC.5
MKSTTVGAVGLNMYYRAAACPLPGVHSTSSKAGRAFALLTSRPQSDLLPGKTRPPRFSR